MVQAAPLPSTEATATPAPTQAPADAFGGNVVGEGLKTLGAVADKASDVANTQALALLHIDTAIKANDATGAAITDLDQLRADYRNNHPGMAASDPANMTEFSNAVDETIAKHAQGLSPMAQVQYLDFSRRYAGMTKGSNVDWAQQQRVKAGSESADALIAMSKDNALANYDDPNAIALATSTIATQNHLKQTLYGWDTPTTQEHIKEDIGSISVSAISQTIDSGDFAKANDMFNAEKANMTAAQQDAVAGRLKSGLSSYEVKSPVDDIYGRGTAPQSTAHIAAAVNATVTHSSISAMQYFESKGLSHSAAAALAGQFLAESDNQANPPGSNDGGAAYGGIQWHADRQADFQAWAGHPIQNSTLKEQYDFALHELQQGKFAGVGARANAAGSPTEASRILTSGYTIPGNQDQEQDARAQVAERIAAGKTGQFTSQGGAPTAPSATTSALKPPPGYQPNEDPNKILSDYMNYNTYVANAMFSNRPAQYQAFLSSANARAEQLARTVVAQQKTVLDQLNGYLSGGLPNGMPVHAFSDLPAALVQQLPVEDRTILQENFNRAVAGYGGFHTPQMTSEANRQEGLAMDPATQAQFADPVRNNLSKNPNLALSDLGRLQSLQFRIQQQEQRAAQELQKGQSLLAIPEIRDVYSSIGDYTKAHPTGDPVADNQTNINRRAEFMGALKGTLEAAHPDGKWTSAEAIKAAQTLAVAHAGQLSQPDWLGNRHPMTVGEGAIPEYNWIPIPRVQQIRDYAAAHNLPPPTSEQIIETYRQRFPNGE